METPQTSEETRPPASRMERITDHLAGISEDARDLVNLRVAMARNNVEEKVDDARSRVGKVQITAAIVQETVKYYLPAAILSIVGLLFVLTTLGFFLGHVLESNWMGFGIVSVVLLVVGGICYALGRRTQRRIVLHHEPRNNQRQLEEKSEE